MIDKIFSGVIINVDGNIEEFKYHIDHYNEDKLDYYIENKGEGEYELVEEIIIENDREEIEKIFWYFGYKNGIKKNEFECIDEIVYGDIIIIGVDKNNEPININFFNDLEDYLPYNLENDIDEEMDEYDFNDGFLINDLS